MEFVVNENGCRNLIEDMKGSMTALGGLVASIDTQNGTLKAALGDDYEAIARSVRVMSSELENAKRELNTIIRDMSEYMARVHQTRVTLQG